MIITGSYCTSYWIILVTVYDHTTLEQIQIGGPLHLGHLIFVTADPLQGAAPPGATTKVREVSQDAMAWQQHSTTTCQALEAEQEQELEIHEDHDDTED